MGIRNTGLLREIVFVGATRPAMRWGVTYSALLFNLVFVMESFLLTRNLLALLLCLPIHAISALLCARDPRFFDLILLWGRTRFVGLLSNRSYWPASSASPLPLELPRRASGRPRRQPLVRVWPSDGQLRCQR